MKRMLSVLIALVICLSMLPVAVPARAVTDGWLTYEIVDGEAVVTKCESYAYGDLVIPADVEGYPVTSIGRAAFNQCILLNSITLPAGIRQIGEIAFHGCGQLKSIYFFGDAPEFVLSEGMCYDHEDNPWDDLDFDFSQQHEYGPFEGVSATAYYFDGAAGWDGVTSKTMTGRGCGYASANGKITVTQLVTASMSGTLTAFGEGAVSMELTSDRSYPLSVSVTENTYLLENLIPGNYTLTLSQEGSLPRTYHLILKEGQITLNLKIHQPGDINGDGKINIGDVARSYAHVKNTVPLTGYQLLCADFTGDGKVTVGDTAKAYSMIQSQ